MSPAAWCPLGVGAARVRCCHGLQHQLSPRRGLGLHGHDVAASSSGFVCVLTEKYINKYDMLSIHLIIYLFNKLIISLQSMN